MFHGPFTTNEGWGTLSLFNIEKTNDVDTLEPGQSRLKVEGLDVLLLYRHFTDYMTDCMSLRVTFR